MFTSYGCKPKNGSHHYLTPMARVAEFRVRTGDRYLGHGRWEHYLGLELYRPSTKKIKISLIHLATVPVPDVVIAPGIRYAIVKVTDSNMTARKVAGPELRARCG